VGGDHRGVGGSLPRKPCVGEKAFAHTGASPDPDGVSQCNRVSTPGSIRYANSLGHTDRNTVAHGSSDTVANGPRTLELVDPPLDASCAGQPTGGRTITAERQAGRIRRVSGGIHHPGPIFTRGAAPNSGREPLRGRSRDSVTFPGSDCPSSSTYRPEGPGFRGDVHRHRSRHLCRRRVRRLAFARVGHGMELRAMALEAGCQVRKGPGPWWPGPLRCGQQSGPR